MKQKVGELQAVVYQSEPRPKGACAARRLGFSLMSGRFGATLASDLTFDEPK
jgi:hypothetical protein